GDVEVVVDGCPGERHVEYTLLIHRAPLACILRDAILQHVRTRGVVILDIAERRRARVVEPLLHPREGTLSRRMWKIGGYWPDACENWDEVCVCVRERELDRLRWRRWLMSQDLRIQIEQRCDKFLATL